MPCYETENKASRYLKNAACKVLENDWNRRNFSLYYQNVPSFLHLKSALLKRRKNFLH